MYFEKAIFTKILQTKITGQKCKTLKFTLEEKMAPRIKTTIIIYDLFKANKLVFGSVQLFEFCTKC